MSESEKKLQSLSEEYQKLQTGTSILPTPSPLVTYTPPDLQSSITARQKLESQQQENKSVQKVPHPYHPTSIP